MLSGITPAHPTRRRLQQPLARIDNRRSPHLLPAHFIREVCHCCIDSRDVAVNVDVLPVALGNVIGLMVDAEMRVGLVVLIPPIPPWTMVLGMGKLVQALDASEVAHFHDLGIGRAVGAVHPACHAEEAEFLPIFVEIGRHGREVRHDVFHARREDAERVVTSRADEEDDDFAVGGFVAVPSRCVGKGGAVFLLDHAVHVDVLLPADGHEVGVGGLVCQDGDGGEQSDAAQTKAVRDYKESGLHKRAEAEPCRDIEVVADVLLTLYEPRSE